MAQMPMQGNPGEESAEGPMKYADENEEMLFGPTTRPQDSMVNAGKRSRVKRTAAMTRYLPMLTHMAESPDAPQELHDLLSVLQFHTGGR